MKTLRLSCQARALVLHKGNSLKGGSLPTPEGPTNAEPQARQLTVAVNRVTSVRGRDSFEPLTTNEKKIVRETEQIDETAKEQAATALSTVLVRKKLKSGISYSACMWLLDIRRTVWFTCIISVKPEYMAKTSHIALAWSLTFGVWLDRWSCDCQAHRLVGKIEISTRFLSDWVEILNQKIDFVIRLGNALAICGNFLIENLCWRGGITKMVFGQ